MDMSIKNAERVELNVKIVSAVLNMQNVTYNLRLYKC